MTKTLAIANREICSFFYSPIAYVVIALFTLLAGLIFVSYVFQPHQTAEMRIMFAAIVWILIPIVPAISMRLMSEELRSGTIEPLMTAPISDTAVIVGKWLGSMSFFAVLLAPTLVYVIILEVWANPDYGPIISGYVGLLMVGGLYLAIGTFASVMTRNQIIAFVVTVSVILLFTFVTRILPRFIGAGSEPLVGQGESNQWLLLSVLSAAAILIGAIAGIATRSVLGGAVIGVGLLIAAVSLWVALTRVEAAHLAGAVRYMNVNNHYDAFAKGLIDLTDITFFVSGIGLFLVLAVKALESRKWR